MNYQEWYELYSKEDIDPNELSANTFGLRVWNRQEQVISAIKEELRVSNLERSIFRNQLIQETQRREDAEKALKFYARKKSWNAYKEYNYIIKDSDGFDKFGGKKAREYFEKYKR
jgi:hypothetical protein